MVLEGVPYFQETLSWEFVAGSLCYELRYVEGATLFEKCMALKAEEPRLIELLNRFLKWYRKHVIYEFDGEYLLINADSNSANIICSDQGFVHIDNQTDFLRTTKSPLRPYLPFSKLLGDLQRKTPSFIDKLAIPDEVKSSVYENEVGAPCVSDLSDLLISADRDVLYRDALIHGKMGDSLLSDLLIRKTSSFEKLFPRPLFNVIERDFSIAKGFLKLNTPDM